MKWEEWRASVAIAPDTQILKYQPNLLFWKRNTGFQLLIVMAEKYCFDINLGYLSGFYKLDDEQQLLPCVIFPGKYS
ncbi:hypothetical protein CS542_04400 [Pedobacter sp. IW39]|nr:hypothetical protein CS542_04400 [Pedobacter sp. IW39]